MDNQIKHMHETTVDYIIAFIGGYIGALSFFLKAHPLFVFTDIFSQIDFPELLNYAVRSTVGGLIGLTLKLLYDLLIFLIRKYLKRKEQSDE